ncbi:MAG TPA: hypothetical protein VFT90_17740 [Chryseosolibacter sp.]|nr:hypothetical protein [Chryseosolibacter sp.]
MDAEFWIYVAIGAIYFLSRFFKKPEEVTGETPEPQQPETRRAPRTQVPTTEAPRQMTFEELLREITEAKQSRPRQPEPAPQPEPVYEQYEKELGDEARSLEDVSYNEAETAQRWKPYEQIPATTERRSLEETLLLEDRKIEFGKFDAFEQKNRNKLLNDYVRLMRNPESLKQAVVMSEILKRKF